MKVLLLTFALLLLPLHLALAAVAHDNSQSVTVSGFDTITISSLAVTGSNTWLVCGATTFVLGATLDFTWDGGAMDEVTTLQGSADFYTAVYSLTGVSGTHDAVFSSGVSMNASFGCSTYTGVDQVTPIASVSSSDDTTPISSVTVPANGMAVDIMGNPAFGDACAMAPLTAGSGQTIRFAACNSGGGDYLTSSSRSTSGTFTWSNQWMQVGIALNPAAAAPSTRRRVVIVQ